MHTIYEITKTYGAGKKEADMWATTKVISDAVEESMPEEAKKKLYDALYGYLTGGHYDEHYAKECVAKMFYTDEEGERHKAPYFTDSVVEEIYENNRDKLSGYTMWDFFVTMNMVASDNHNLIVSWFPEATSEERLEKYSELAVNWLNDEDYPPKSKIWDYLH